MINPIYVCFNFLIALYPNILSIILLFMSPNNFTIFFSIIQIINQGAMKSSICNMQTRLILQKKKEQKHKVYFAVFKKEI